MLNKKVLGIAGAVLAAGIYAGLDTLADRNIEYNIKKVGIMPSGPAISLPGKKDKSIDLYLENLGSLWDSTSPGGRIYVTDGVLLFTRDQRPERIEEVYGEVLEFLARRNIWKLVGTYAKDYKRITGDDIFCRKYFK